MRSEDTEVMSRVFPKWAEPLLKSKLVCNVALVSPCQFEVEIISKLFPDAWYETYIKESWDLNEPGKSSSDLILACNLFMYSPNPALWFKNIFAKCKYFWIQDLIRSARMPDSEVANGPGGDGDCMRFCKPPQDIARFENAYDLNQLNSRLVDYVSYPTVGRPDKDSLSFIAFFKGDL